MRQTKFIPIAWIWLLHVVITTVGVPVHKLYCACTGQVAFSLLQASHRGCDTPQSNATEPGCCTKPTVAGTASLCCSETASFCAPADGRPCWDDEVVILQLDTDYVLESSSDGCYHILSAWNVPFPEIFHYPARLQILTKQIPEAFKSPPNRPFGRFLLPRLQSWLC